jgi:aminopyrrolnitrin oxygenase
MSIDPAFARVPQSWYRVCRSRDLPRGTVLSWTLPDLPLVLYRGASGSVVAMDAQCAHMGAHLRHGRVVGDDLQCALHHWTCGADGDCRAPVGHGRLNQNVYPTVERYGAVFVFAGRAPRFDLPDVGRLEDRQIRMIAGRPRFIRTSWASIATNAFDVAHMDVVHGRAMREEPRLTLAGSDCLEMHYVSRVTGRGVSDRVMRWLSNDSIRVSIACWGGTLIVVRSQAGAIDSHLLLCLTPGPDGVEIAPFFGKPKRGARVVDEIALRVSRWLFTEFLRRDLVPLDGMKLRIGGATASPGAIGWAARWLVTLPAAATTRPDDLRVLDVIRVSTAEPKRAESRV